MKHLKVKVEVANVGYAIEFVKWEVEQNSSFNCEKA